MSSIAVCIPTRQGPSKLDYVLPYYDRQIYKDYELVLHNDNEGSAAKARNRLANLVSDNTEYLLFVGDDCIPDRSLIYRYQLYLKSNPKTVAIQGFSPFHPAVMDTYFMHFLDRAGIQANWYALLDANKQWKTDATGFCLTTNYLIRKDVFFELGGFNEAFPNAAWEDIEFGERLVQYGVKTAFLPSAQNFHYHKYKFTEFINRQIMEGKNRVVLATLRPETAGSVLSPDGIRNAASQKGAELEITNRCIQLIKAAMNIKEARPSIDEKLKSALNLFSFFGVYDSIQNTPFMVLEHCKNQMSSVHVASAVKSIGENNYAYALHCAGWLKMAENGDWYTALFEALMHNKFGEKDRALDILLRTSVSENKWQQYVAKEIKNA